MLLTGSCMLFCCLIYSLCIQGAEAVYEFFADLQLVLAVCLDNNIRGSLIFLASFLHQLCDKIDILIAFQKRSVMIVLDTVQNGLRFSGEKNYTSVFSSSRQHCALSSETPPPQEITTFSGLHLDQQLCLQITEVLLSISLKDIRDGHSLSLCNDLIHLYHVHGKNSLQKIRDCGFARSP